MITVKETALGTGKYLATDHMNVDWTNDIPVRILKTAALNGWEIDARQYPNGKRYFKYIKNGKPNKSALSNTHHTHLKVKNESKKELIPLTDTLKEKYSSYSEMSSSEIKTLVDGSVSLIPTELSTSELLWKALVRNTLRMKNILIVGPSGEGKTLHTRAVATALNRPYERVDCGQTQDAEASLIGKTHYDPETGTFFNPSKLVKAIQTPNCVVVLDEISRLSFEGQNIVFPLLDPSIRELTLTTEIGTPTIKVADGVSFICTANIGNQFHATNALDEALLNRLTMLEIKALTYDQRLKLFKSKFDVEKSLITKMLTFADALDQELQTETSKITRTVSTRQLEDIMGYLEDGFEPLDVFQLLIFPIFSSDGLGDSERSYVVSVCQKVFGSVNSENTLGTMKIS